MEVRETNCENIIFPLQPSLIWKGPHVMLILTWMVILNPLLLYDVLEAQHHAQLTLHLLSVGTTFCQVPQRLVATTMEPATEAESCSQSYQQLLKVGANHNNRGWKCMYERTLLCSHTHKQGWVNDLWVGMVQEQDESGQAALVLDDGSPVHGVCGQIPQLVHDQQSLGFPAHGCCL